MRAAQRGPQGCFSLKVTHRQVASMGRTAFRALGSRRFVHLLDVALFDLPH
jgi:hypothetical protein